MASNVQDFSIRSTDPKVRSACDKCRSQKLKCDQSSNPNDAGKCTRCLKSKSDCITSAPRPSGRPSRQQSRQQAKSRKSNHMAHLEVAQTSPSFENLATFDPVSYPTP